MKWLSMGNPGRDGVGSIGGVFFGGKLSRFDFPFVAKHALVILLLLAFAGVLSACGSTESGILPQATIPLPKEDEDGHEGIVVSTPDSLGYVTISGTSDLVSQDMLLVTQVVETSSDIKALVDDSAELDSDGAQEAEDALEEATAGCGKELPTCPELDSDGLCQHEAEDDGSFYFTVPAQVSDTVKLSYQNLSTCESGDVAEVKIQTDDVKIKKEEVAIPKSDGPKQETQVSTMMEEGNQTQTASTTSGASTNSGNGTTSTTETGTTSSSGTSDTSTTTAANTETTTSSDTSSSGTTTSGTSSSGTATTGGEDKKTDSTIASSDGGTTTAPVEDYATKRDRIAREKILKHDIVNLPWARVIGEHIYAMVGLNINGEPGVVYYVIKAKYDFTNGFQLLDLRYVTTTKSVLEVRYFVRYLSNGVYEYVVKVIDWNMGEKYLITLNTMEVKKVLY